MEWKQSDKGVFLVNVLGIVYNPKTKKILIGMRENDPYIKELTWCFPGGRPGYGDLELHLKQAIKSKTGLNVKIKKIVFAKTHPEKREFLSIYYYCETSKEHAKAGGQFKELKWIKPTDVKKYFTTSVHPEIMKFLRALK